MELNQVTELVHDNYQIIWNSFKITKRWRGGIISFNDLKVQGLYGIYFNKNVYCIGRLEGVKELMGGFRIMKCHVGLDGELYFPETRYFEPAKIFMFKCIVDFDEQEAAYRAAFEKRAVNQIVGNIIGHPGDYY